MSIDQATIDRLVTWLSAADPHETFPSPGEPERALLAGALAELATSQAVIARQRLLLACHNQTSEDLEKVTSTAVHGLLRDAGWKSDPGKYDHTAAEAARRELVRRVEDASATRDVLAHVLRFVARLAG